MSSPSSLGKANLAVHFGVIDYSGQEHNKYYYKLLPLQNSWLETTSEIINFNNLSPKKYELQIKAVNPYRQELIKKVYFTIQPLWWQTPWAKLLFIVLGIFFVGTLIYQIRRQELKKQRQKLIAQKDLFVF